jgi:type VI secretion system secreted protein Hcp
MAVDMFLWIDGIEGESEDATYPKWIECNSWSHGFEQPTNPARSQSAATIERCTHNPFSVTRKLDQASIPIMIQCWKGKIHPTIMFAQKRASDKAPAGNKYIEVTMLWSVVASYEISGSEGDIAEETVTFNYGSLSYNYVPIDKKTGEAKANKYGTHNLIENTFESS